MKQNSMLMASAARHVAAALALIVALWLAVAWAMTSGPA